MSIDLILGPLSESESRRVARYVEGIRTGQRAQGKSDDPLRRVAELIVEREADELPGGAWAIALGDDEDLLDELRAGLVEARVAHAVIAPDEETGLTEHISWHTHGNDEHEWACLRTASGRVAMTHEVWARLALVTRDDDLRLRLNDYFFFAGHGDATEIPVDIDPEVPDAERWAADEPVLLPDEWSVIGRTWGDLELRDRLNAFFEDAERALDEDEEEELEGEVEAED